MVVRNMFIGLNKHPIIFIKSGNRKEKRKSVLDRLEFSSDENASHIIMKLNEWGPEKVLNAISLLSFIIELIEPRTVSGYLSL